MADYFPLIARAVAGLERNTGAARRSLYDHARTALLKQLRAATPTLCESDVTRERLLLENAIREVESTILRQQKGVVQQVDSERLQRDRLQTQMIADEKLFPRQQEKSKLLELERLVLQELRGEGSSDSTNSDQSES